MVKFLKIFFRKKFIKNKLSLLNISGLVLGMFTFIFIYFYVFIENNYDQHQENSAEIFHIYADINKNGVSNLYSSTPIPMAEAIYNEVAMVEDWATYCSIFESSVLNNGDNDFLRPDILYANSGFFKVFNHQLIHGSFGNALLEPGTAVITKSAALKYLGEVNVVGRQLKVFHDTKEPLLVTIGAVIEDVPMNSNIRFEMVCSLDDFLDIVGDWVNNWYFKASQSYILLKPSTDLAEVQRQINLVVGKYMNDRTDEQKEVVTVYVENISQKHFKKEYTLQHPTETFIDPISLKILFSVGLITLIISWLNYINFSVFQNSYEFKEIGIRKIVGSTRTQLFVKLLKESLLLAIIPAVISIGLFYIVSPILYGALGLDIQDIRIESNIFWIIVLSLFIGGSIISAVYPIIRLMRFQPINILRNKINVSSSANKGRVFLTIQFALAIILICGIVLIHSQMTFLGKQQLGFEKENILVLSPPITSSTDDYIHKMELFKMEAKKSPSVIALSGSSSVPGKKLITEHFGIKNKEETINKYLGLYADEDYFDAIGINFLEGRNFSMNENQRYNDIIINETMAKKLGFENIKEAIGQPGNWGEQKIVGVVEDYHHLSLHDDIKPILFKYGLDRLTFFIIKLNSSDPQKDIAFLQEKWNQTFVNSPFVYSFLEDEFNMQYAEEKGLFTLVSLFSLISIIITILGVIGACLNETYARIKEIGIRKVNGARIIEILLLLNKGFIKWVAAACIIATPLAWFAMHKWLENFAYKTNLSWWIFALAGVSALGIAMLTVSFQSYRAAMRNPVESLRYE